MRIFEKKSVIKIDGEDVKDARLSSTGFTDEQVKKRAYMNVLGARLAMKMLFSQKIEANNLYSLYTIHSVLEELNISDVYYNGLRMDVRLVFDKDQIFVPKAHFNYELTPDAYLVLQLKEDLSGADFLGFFEPKDLNKENANTDYYFYEFEKLQKPEELKSFLEHFIVENNTSEEGNAQAEALFLSFVDKEISNSDKAFLLKRLANSLPLREKIVEFENFEIISKRVAQTQGLLQDGLLDIVGSQQLYEEEENQPATKAEVKAEVIGEVLTDLLGEDEEEEKKTDSLVTGETIAAGGLALAAGLGLGAEAIKASSQAAAAGAEAQAGLIAGGADILSSGMDLGGKLMENSFKSAETPSDQSDLLNEIDDFLNQNENLDALNELSNIRELEPTETVQEETLDLDTLDELADMSESEPTETDKGETLDLDSLDLDSIDTELSNKDEIFDIESLATEISGEDESISFDSIDTIPDEESPFEFDEFTSEIADLDEITSDIEEITEETTNFENIEEEINEISDLAEIEDISPLEDLEEIETIEPEVEVESEPEISSTTKEEEEEEVPAETDENVFDLENFDFEMLNEDNETDSDAISLDSLDSEEPKQEEIQPISEDGEMDAIQRLQQLEEQEDAANTETNSETANDDFMSDVDNFLNDIELSDEQKNLLASELASDIDLDESSTTPVANKSDISDDLFMDTDALLAQAEGGSGSDKDPLKLLFKDGETEVKTEGINFDMKRIPNADLLKNKKVIVAASVAGAMIVSLAVAGMVMHPKTGTTDIAKDKTTVSAPGETPGSTPGETAPEDMSMDLNSPVAQNAMPSQAQDIPAEPSAQKADTSRDMGKAVSDAFLSEPVNANITKVAWEVPEDLAYNDSFRKYLQMAGKNLKLNLQNDLLLATEMAYSNKIVVDLEIAGNGNLNAENVVVSSGSKQIDKIVLQSIKDTLKYLKVPTSELRGKSTVATLIINF